MRFARLVTAVVAAFAVVPALAVIQNPPQVPVLADGLFPNTSRPTLRCRSTRGGLDGHRAGRERLRPHRAEDMEIQGEVSGT